MKLAFRLRAGRGHHLDEVWWRVRPVGRPEHAHAFGRPDRDVQLGEAAPRLAAGSGAQHIGRADGPTRLERTDEDAERRRRPLELLIDLVDERSADEPSDRNARNDEHCAHDDDRRDETTAQRHISPDGGRTRRRAPS